jgi:hypothetical protein
MGSRVSPNQFGFTRRKQMTNLQTLIEEIAHIALEDENIRDYIGVLVDANDEVLERLFQYLDRKLNKEVNT